MPKPSNSPKPAPQDPCPENTSLGAIATTIAHEHNLRPAMSKTLASHHIAYAAQTEESDPHVLTRLGRRIGAVIAPKDGRLLVTARHSGKTVSGKPPAPLALPTIFVTPNLLIAKNAYNVRIKPRSRYSRVIARWQDQDSARVHKLTLQAAPKGPSMTLREVFQTEAEARKAAEAKVKELRAGEGELSLDMVGAPKARAGEPSGPRSR